MGGNRLSSVANAARILRSFTTTSPTWGVTALANELDLSKSSVHRILSTLVDEGVLERSDQAGQYRLGLSIFDLAAAMPTQRQLSEAVLVPMTQLRHHTGETVQVAVLDGRQVVYVERLNSPNTFRVFTELGRRNQAHCSSCGKVLLAFSDAALRERLLTGWDLKAVTERTIVDGAALRRELEETRRRGYGQNLHESEIGVVSFAAPIRDERGTTVAALSVAGPAERVEPQAAQFIEAVRMVAKQISIRMGWDSPRQDGWDSPRNDGWDSPRQDGLD